MPLYLYGVVRSGSTPPRGVDLVAPSTGGLRVQPHEDLGGLVAGIAAGTVKMSPPNVAAHHEVVERAASGGVILPARFGTTVESARALRERLLAPRVAELRQALDSLEGNVELRIALDYVGDAALREVVVSHPRLRRLTGSVRAKAGAAGYYDRISLGELVVDQLTLLHDRDLKVLLGRIRPHVEAQRLLDGARPGSSRVALLVRRDGMRAALDTIDRYADEQSERMSVDVVGPLAPWDFVGATTDPAVGGNLVGAASEGGATWAS